MNVAMRKITDKYYKMKPLNYTAFLLCINSILFSQVLRIDSLPKNYFQEYNILFIGEQHNISNTEIAEAKIMSKVQDSNKKVCLEAPGDMNIIFDKENLSQL